MNSGSTIFDNVPKTNLLELYHGNQLEYEKVIGLLEFSKSEISKISGIPVGSVRYDQRIPKEIEDRLNEWAVALELVAQFFQEAGKAVLWFKIPNPMLGNVTPRDMIRVGRFKKLISIIQNS